MANNPPVDGKRKAHEDRTGEHRQAGLGFSKGRWAERRQDSPSLRKRRVPKRTPKVAGQYPPVPARETRRTLPYMCGGSWVRRQARGSSELARNRMLLPVRRPGRSASDLRQTSHNRACEVNGGRRVTPICL